MTVQEVLNQCVIENDVIKLPDYQLDRKLYTDVKKAFGRINLEWKGGKISGFISKDGSNHIEKHFNKLLNGERPNIQKELQAFFTPSDLADRMVTQTFTQSWIGKGLPDGVRVLEPSAGQGALIKAAQRYLEVPITVYAIELDELNRSYLDQISGVMINKKYFDFMEFPGETQYDIIIANPPFTKNQDIDHVEKMWQLLKPGGVLTTIMSNSWIQGGQKKQSSFREWLGSTEHIREELPYGTFKESGTMVGAQLLTIEKEA